MNVCLHFTNETALSKLDLWTHSLVLDWHGVGTQMQKVRRLMLFSTFSWQTQQELMLCELSELRIGVSAIYEGYLSKQNLRTEGRKLTTADKNDISLGRFDPHASNKQLQHFNIHADPFPSTYNKIIIIINSSTVNYEQK